MFKGCLDERFWSEIATRLSSIQAGKPLPEDFRVEDPHKLKDVMEAAETLASSAGGSFTSASGVKSSLHVSTNKETVEMKAEVEEIKQVVAGLQDRVDATQKTMTEGFSELKQTLHQNSMSLQNALAQSAVSTQRQAPPPAQYNSWNKTGPPTMLRPGCFYCHEDGHMMDQCPERSKHLEQKKTIIHEGKVKMFDGSWIPGGPRDIPIMDRVEATWNKKNNVTATAQLYLGPEDEEERGMYYLPERDQNMFSTYTNAVQDNRDEIINQLRRQVNQLQSSRTQEPSRSYSPNHGGYTSDGRSGPRFQDNRDYASDRLKQNDDLSILTNLLGRVLSRDQFVLRFFILYHMTLLFLLSTDYLHMTHPSIYIHMFTRVVIILVIYPVA
ncbi:hypothetical protein BDZ94DRAFT_1316523 [Collybia nuda]|uniref:CCHC-type domain-containing protein n=1 Tax=Collybia nuda TaxID=64659 RepID=A0A9P6CBK1_9AGAR|nr:hypothetical protein BDZ94DRAFT_1316523 [Collybia nuda]